MQSRKKRIKGRKAEEQKIEVNLVGKKSESQKKNNFRTPVTTM